MAYKNDNSAYLRFRVMSPDPYFYIIFVSEAVTVRNILMILGRSVGYKNDNPAYLHFLIMSPDPIFYLFSFLEYNSVTIRNILMILGRIIEPVNMECCIQE